MWLLLLVRMLIPFGVETPVSVYNHVQESLRTIPKGFETIYGMECVRIKSQVKGRTQGTGKLEGQDFKATSGDSDSSTTMTWYFAYKKGIFVNSVAESIGSMEASHGPLEAPLMTKTKTTVELVL